jgi:formyl-CoA transferase
LIVGVANDRLFVKLAHTLGRSEWASDPRFRTNADRLAHRDYLLKEIRAAFREKTKEHWIDTLEAAGVPCAPILTIPEVLAQPQTDALGIFRRQAGLDTVLANLPFSFDGKRAALDRAAPRLGQHNEEVFKK